MRPLAAALLILASMAAAAADAPPPAALAAWSGKVVYLDFWASWCGPCADSFPWLNRMHAKYGSELTIVGVNVDTDAAAADAFLKRFPASFEILRDPAGVLPEHYQIEGMPSAVILDASGRVLHQHAGFRPAQVDEYEAAIRDALANHGAGQVAGGSIGVKPWQRGTLAREDMQVNADALQAGLDDHIYFSKEASSGGRGFGGGGCGCN